MALNLSNTSSCYVIIINLSIISCIDESGPLFHHLHLKS